MYKDKDIFVFVRFGGLNLKTQEGFGEKFYHSPPVSKGLYAMPKIAQELFLIGCIDKTQPGIFPKNINISDDKRKEIYRQIRKEFKKEEGCIWSHLGEYFKPNQILSIHNSWVKTSIKDWAKAFSKMSIILRSEGLVFRSGITGCYSKDHCEVFFDEKI
ncbi:MAG: hypothetical protein PHF86_01320 [Candidatus Nanoarchaeia archaeon]|nr:hypothetical protein [Candidatus Nanoarchaeia archaeon]